MARLEDLNRGATVKGILPDRLVTVVDVKWYGSSDGADLQRRLRKVGSGAAVSRP